MTRGYTPRPMTPSASPDASAGVTIDEVDTASPEVVDALRALVPDLSRSAPPLTAADVQAIVASPATILLVARDGSGVVLGSLTLVVFRAPTGPRAWIEDVVVAPATRGRGIGEQLVLEALRRAKAAGSRTVDLTSRPSREAANRLYVRLGFSARETNVYRHSLE